MLNRPSRSFLKWAGSKFDLIERINDRLPESKTLIEPFVGSGVVFLNTNHKKYILADINQDLINLYLTIQKYGAHFIDDAEKYFSKKTNTEKHYYKLREVFNSSTDKYEKSLIFLYMNRHCYNGLCRYNQSEIFNVPFGRYKAPRFPEEALHLFYLKSKYAKFYCESFIRTFKRAKRNSVIYCDPPYLPLSATSNFTTYSTVGFSLEDQELLAKEAWSSAQKGIPVLISNHDTKEARKMYKGASLVKFNARRRISCNALKRGDAKEILALFD
jgi:DNA adenine methylase